ncbi:hypothetical protein HNQ91_003600 [Filimonas zeae]|uniref:hypothetical protein n=1 Tax=Filimonas zeae TaxID=1737353 RepID=UPI00166675C2|nr:hypothetical protein [Filimonas zeae]MDR6340535.1 hypothetical protein [Filimonas zeae]
MYLLSDTETTGLATIYVVWLAISFILMMLFVYIAARKRRSWLAVRRKTLWLEEDFIP